jgi:predicted dienelactone hydrolase
MHTTPVLRGRKVLVRAVLPLLVLIATAVGCAGTPPTGGGGLPTAELAVDASVGFGGGTIYYPSQASGRFGAVSLTPGFTENAAAIAHWGPYLASEGFVVIIINTTSGLITPEQRSDEQLQALDYVIQQSNTASSPIAGKVDPNRTAVGGHSMGGGASVLSARNRPTLDAIVPLTPWLLYQEPITVPALFFACQSDVIAPVATNASPLYEAATGEKLFVSVAGGDHFCVNSPNAVGAGEEVGETAVAFLDRFVNGDTSVVGELCGAGAPTVGTAFDDVRSTCPL